jgi:hypothetical protein
MRQAGEGARATPPQAGSFGTFPATRIACDM